MSTKRSRSGTNMQIIWYAPSYLLVSLYMIIISNCISSFIFWTQQQSREHLELAISFISYTQSSELAQRLLNLLFFQNKPFEFIKLSRDYPTDIISLFLELLILMNYVFIPEWAARAYSFASSPIAIWKPGPFSASRLSNEKGKMGSQLEDKLRNS